MNKTDLIAAIAAKGGEKKTAANALKATLSGIEEGLSSGKKVVRIVGFGTFSVVPVKEKKVRNPQTGQLMTVPASNRIKFTASKVLKDRFKKRK